MLKAGPDRRIWQEGNLPVFMSMCMTLPELRIAVVALATRMTETHRARFQLWRARLRRAWMHDRLRDFDSKSGRPDCPASFIPNHGPL